MSSDDNSQECQEEQHHIRKKARLSNDNENNENNENEVDVNASADISAMYMMASLIPSTRHFYSFSSNTNNSINASSADTQIGNRMTRATVEQMNHHHRNNGSNREKTPSEGNSDGLSSWTPSISFNDFGLNENSRKNIDNDNRESERSVGCSEESISSSDENDDTYNRSGSSLQNSEEGGDMNTICKDDPLGSYIDSAMMEEAYAVVG